jgi:hypothetical protein
LLEPGKLHYTRVRFIDNQEKRGFRFSPGVTAMEKGLLAMGLPLSVRARE